MKLLARTNAEIEDLARQVAEAQIDLSQVRYARQRLLSDKMNDPNFERRAIERHKIRVLLRGLPVLLRPNAPDILLELLSRYLVSKPQGPEKFPTIVLEEVRQLSALERYERRAQSRRKFAIRALIRLPTSTSNIEVEFWQNEAKKTNKFSLALNAVSDPCSPYAPIDCSSSTALPVRKPSEIGCESALAPAPPSRS